MAFYTGDKFEREGDLFVGALRDQMLVRVKLDGEKVVSEERLLKGGPRSDPRRARGARWFHLPAHR